MAGGDVTRYLAMAALVSVVAPHRVEAVLRSCGRVAQRVRTLPPWVTTYHVLVSAMCPSMGYDEVTGLLWSTLPAATGRSLARQQPSRGAITRARTRLGAEPLELLLEELLGSHNPSREIYLQKASLGVGRSLWWIGDGDSGALRGCELHGDDLRGDDADAVVRMVTRAAPEHAVVCPPRDETGRRILEQLRQVLPVTVGDLPDHLGSPWAGLRVRSSATWAQDALARACVVVAGESALGLARAATPTP